MHITGKLEVEVDINCHGDIFHEIFSTRPHDVSTMSPENIHGCDVHDGECGKPGAIIFWNYTLGNYSYTRQIIFVIIIMPLFTIYMEMEYSVLNT